MRAPTVIAVDWSGAKVPRGIWVAVIDAGRVVESRGGWTRESAVDFVQSVPAPVIAGFDFSFGLPAWFARAQGCKTMDAVWSLAAARGDQWLQPTPPFWRNRCDLPRELRFRQCEQRLGTAKSVFQLVGNGQVGAASIRGMPLLAELRADGFGIWPFDAPSDRTALEIYPSALRRLAPEDDVGPWTCNDERDAVVSARVMWRSRDAIRSLPSATDPITRLEGDVWLPT